MTTNKLIKGLFYILIGLAAGMSLLIIVVNTLHYLDTGLWTGELKYQTAFYAAVLMIVTVLPEPSKGKEE